MVLNICATHLQATRLAPSLRNLLKVFANLVSSKLKDLVSSKLKNLVSSKLKDLVLLAGIFARVFANAEVNAVFCILLVFDLTTIPLQMQQGSPSLCQIR
jgi:hypothetical protein